MFLESYLRQLQVTFTRRRTLLSTDERKPLTVKKKKNVRDRTFGRREFVDNLKNSFLPRSSLEENLASDSIEHESFLFLHLMRFLF